MLRTWVSILTQYGCHVVIILIVIFKASEKARTSLCNANSRQGTNNLTTLGQHPPEPLVRVRARPPNGILGRCAYLLAGGCGEWRLLARRRRRHRRRRRRHSVAVPLDVSYELRSA